MSFCCWHNTSPQHKIMAKLDLKVDITLKKKGRRKNAGCYSFRCDNELASTPYQYSSVLRCVLGLKGTVAGLHHFILDIPVLSFLS